MFKIRPHDSIAVCRSVPEPYVEPDLSADRTFSVRERVQLHPQDSTTPLMAEVVRADGDHLHVRSVGWLNTPDGRTVIREGDEFDIRRNLVWVVTTPD